MITFFEYFIYLRKVMVLMDGGEEKKDGIERRVRR